MKDKQPRKRWWDAGFKEYQKKIDDEAQLSERSVMEEFRKYLHNVETYWPEEPATPQNPLEKEVAKLTKFINRKNYKMEKAKIVIFYGFTGKMKYQYSTVEANKKELQARMSTISKMIDIPWSLHDMDVWEETVKDSGTSTPFVEIKFEDAMSIIRAENYGEKKEELVPFEESEEEEFTDNCTADCSPGDHKCGKK